MIHISPLEDSVAVQEVVQREVAKHTRQKLEEGLVKGLAKGRAEGKLIGQIQQAQRLLHRPQTTEKKLLQQTPKELRVLLKQLEAELH